MAIPAMICSGCHLLASCTWEVQKHKTTIISITFFIFQVSLCIKNTKQFPVRYFSGLTNSLLMKKISAKGPGN